MKFIHQQPIINVVCVLLISLKLALTTFIINFQNYGTLLCVLQR